ncbi:tetratricopeptide repeat protein [Paenibacillus alvei]|uniref:tetratricopeptide repeat protein n=1 Tax=Paenibacillus alvei TaxID=44250 RepID=UPI00227F0077|nr:tetratricopeptide repeat protein [Paenibacillus alvei]
MAEQNKVVMFPMDAASFSERAVQSLERLHYDKALTYFRKAVECEPDNPILQCNLAGTLAEAGRFEESNDTLHHILHELDPNMNECYYYMANNFAYMEQFEESEAMLETYLSRDLTGMYTEEAEEMLEMIRFEAKQSSSSQHRGEQNVGVQSSAAKLPSALSDEEMGISEQAEDEHAEARMLLEAGRFVEAEKLLKRVVDSDPDYLAAWNNLALAYYYMGQFDEAREALDAVLERDQGNLHALCNLAIFERHAGNEAVVQQLIAMIGKIQPFYREHLFKIATTMGMLDEHELAYQHLRRLVTGHMLREASIYHYAAVAACRLGRYEEASRWWAVCRRLDPDSGIATYYMERLQQRDGGDIDPMPTYHYRLPYEEASRRAASKAASTDGSRSSRSGDGKDWEQQLKKDPLVRASLFWALRFGEPDVKLQALQAMSLLGDDEANDALRSMLLDPDQDAYLKQVAVYVLRMHGVEDPIEVEWKGEYIQVHRNHIANRLPVWESQWQQVLDILRDSMKERYDLFQMHDAETLWIEFITHLYPDEVPRIGKAESWAAAIEFIIAKMIRREMSYQLAAEQYGVSATTVAKHAKRMEDTCQVEAKIKQSFT